MTYAGTVLDHSNWRRGGGGGGIITSKTIGIFLMESIVFFSRGFIYLFCFFIQYITKI